MTHYVYKTGKRKLTYIESDEESAAKKNKIDKIGMSKSKFLLCN